MAQFKAGTFAKSTGGAPTSQSVTGIGFTPKALILWGVPLTAAGFAGGFSLAYGFTDGTNRFCMNGRSRDATGASDTSRSHSASGVYQMRNPANGALLAFADITSFDSDGFTLSWTTNNATAYLICYLAIGGAEVSAFVDFFVGPGSTGESSVTGVGFRPTGMLTASISNATIPINDLGHNDLGIGAASAAARQQAVGLADETGQGTSDAARKQTASVIQTLFASGAHGDLVRATLVSFDADGFTWDWARATTNGLGYLALSGVEIAVGVGEQPTAVGPTVTGNVGIEPGALLLFGDNFVATDDLQDHDRVFIGASDGASNVAVWAGATDAVGTTSTDSALSTTKAVIHIDSDAPSAVNAEAAVLAFGSSDFTLDWTTADAVAREFIYVAFEAARRLSQTQSMVVG